MSSAVRRGSRSNWIFWGLALLVAMHLALSYNIVLKRAFDYGDYIQGLVAYPYRTRRLMAWVFRCAMYVGHALHAKSETGDTRGPIWWCELGTVAASVFAAIWATRRSIETVLGRETVWVWTAFLVPYMAYFHLLLIGEIRVQTPYDLPSMAFYAVGLYAVLGRNRPLFYAIFIAATLNRETALFLPLLFFLRQMREDVRLPKALRRTRPTVWLELVLQLALWAGLRAWSNSLVARGTLGEARFIPQNLHFLLSPLHWPTLASVFGFLWIPFLLFFKRIPSVYLKRCVLLAPLWLLLMFKYGDFLEIRIHSEWISYVAVCIALLLDAAFTLKTTTQSASVQAGS